MNSSLAVTEFGSRALAAVTRVMGDNIVIDPCTASMVELSWEVLQAVATVNLHSLVLHVKVSAKQNRQDCVNFLFLILF